MPAAARLFNARNAARRQSTETWCTSAVNFSFLFLLTASRMRACAWDTALRLCVRPCVASPHSLGPTPSLHRLRRSAGHVVRRLPRYSGWVRLSPHRASRASASGLPRAAPGAAAQGNAETSRFPRRRCAHMPGSQTARSRSGTRDRVPDHIAFCRNEGIGTPDDWNFAAQWLAYAFPCQRFTRRLATTRA
jgi:hypothetical protein